MELIAIFLPLCAFLIAGLFGKPIGDKGAQFITCAAVSIAAIASIVLFFDVILTDGMVDGAYTTVLGTWITSGKFSAQWALRIDQLSVVMICVVNIISACVHIYSIGYMQKDPHKARFMAYLSLFTFTMLMLVSSDNLLQLFFGWEGVGLSSYLLIGFWSHKQSANSAAIKAFVVNRIGDLGLILAIMTIFMVFGTLNFTQIFENPEQYAQTVFPFLGIDLHALTLICMLLFIGAIGKSAQLGLHTWLPDAMEGPTPVSALIHAATMVTAGVFLIARFSPLFEYAPDASMVVTLVGATTAFVAATIALTQFDIKRVIAYSTMSQLGYMFFALGVSAYGAAMFHLVTHAFFKALLFLGAGSVIHAMANDQDMRNMGGIWKKIPTTYTLMVIGSLALCGMWPFAGFYSKDIILEAAWADHSWFGHYAYWMGIAAAFMTALYSWRLLIMTFHGEPRAIRATMEKIHESPSIMIMPLLVLATGAILAGGIFYGGFVGSPKVEPHHISAEVNNEENSDKAESQAKPDHGEVMINLWSRPYFWHNSLQVLPENDTIEAAHESPIWVKLLPMAMGVLGILFAYLAYVAKPSIPSIICKIFLPIYVLFFNKWFFDRIYNFIIVKPIISIGHIFNKSDKDVIDAVGPDGFAGFTSRFSKSLSNFQSGYVYHYAFVMIISLVCITSWFVFKADPSFYASADIPNQMPITLIEEGSAR